MPTLEIRQLTHRFARQTVLRNLTLATSEAVYGISGSNGSGKSTLMRCLAGLLKPTAGTVRWTINGNRLTGLEMLGQVGFASPYVELYEGLSARENLHFLAKVHRNRNAVPLDELLERCQAGEFSEKLYGELSTGQRQRIKLAAALLHRPQVICLDEPGANLDRMGRELVRRTVEEESQKGTMVVIASNQPDELALCRDRLDLDTATRQPLTP